MLIIKYIIKMDLFGSLLQSCLLNQCFCHCLTYNNTQINGKNTTIKQYLSPIHWDETTQFIPPIEKGQVIKVYDGDTITIASKLPYNESLMYRFQVRFLGIDSPEIKGKTEEEKSAAKISQKALENIILHKMVYLKNMGHEKYGRILADVYVDHPEIPNTQIHLNKWMLDNGYAIKYDGKTKTPFSNLDKDKDGGSNQI